MLRICLAHTYIERYVDVGLHYLRGGIGAFAQPRTMTSKWTMKLKLVLGSACRACMKWLKVKCRAVG